jgi:hypothetical protein
MTEILEPYHYYDAQAAAFEGELRLPLRQEIHPQAFVKLPVEGGYLAQRSCGFRVESVLSFASAYTQVAGNRDLKPGHGHSTLVTSVIEGLNVLDVVTADRVVGQISTEHPHRCSVPSITFLGTRFENLRIAGHKVELDLDLNICGERPDNDAPYTKSSGFAARVSQQHARIRDLENGYPNPFAELRERFNLVPERFGASAGGEEIVECSLVNQAEGSFPGRRFGHVIHIPHFGTIYLAVLRLRHVYSKTNPRDVDLTAFELTMIDFQLGCPIDAKLKAAPLVANGTGKTVTPPPPPSSH